MANPVQDWQYQAIDAINHLVTCNGDADAVLALQRVQAHLEARIDQCRPLGAPSELPEPINVLADPDEDLV